jgi:FO synthase
MRVQVPPNLSDPDSLPLLLGAGVDDWGGVSPVTPDHVNPERPWPDLDVLAAATSLAGLQLRARLTIHPWYVRAGEPWLEARLRPHVAALADSEIGLARTDLTSEGRGPRGIGWQHDDAGWVSSGRVGLHHQIDTVGRLGERRSDAGQIYGDWASLRADAEALVSPGRSPARSRPSEGGSPDATSRDATSPDATSPDAMPHRRDREVLRALSVAADAPASLTTQQALLLISSTGQTLDEVCAIADDVRRDVVGEPVSYVVTRNINFTNICYVGCRFCAFAQRRTDADAFTLSLEEVAARAAQAWQLGASEVCVQGGIHPDLPGTGYFELARAIKKAAPGIHLHAFSPMEVMTGMARTGTSAREFLTELKAAGVDSIPGTAAEILDDDVRWVLTKGKLPADDWEQIVVTAHEVGLPSTSTMMYGHVDEPRHWVAHLRRLARIQRRTGGFTEFVPLPFVHRSAPIYLAGVARPGPGRDENRAVHAMARLLLHGVIDNVQVSWVKLGEDGAAAMLRSGCNDLGGTLMEETISRMAGADHGSSRTPAELEAIATGIGRPAWQRSTLYGTVPRARQLVAQRVRGYLPLLSVDAVAARP